MREDKERFRLSRAVLIAGACLSAIIGPSFSAGTHTLQFHASQGLWGYASIAIAAVMSSIVIYLAFGDFKRFGLHNLHDVLTHYCGRYIGAVVRWVLIAVYVFDAGSMISGVATTLNVVCNVPPFWGAIAMLALSAALLLFGSKRFIQILSNAAIVLMVLIAAICVVAMLHATDALAEGAVVISQASQDVRIASNPIASGLLQFTATSMFDMGFVATLLSVSTVGNREMRAGATATFSAFAFLMLLIMTAVFGNASLVAGSDVPLVQLALGISPALTAFFAVVLIVATLTSVSGEVWIITQHFMDEGSKWYKPVCLAITVVAYGITYLGPYALLANIAFKSCSYVGVLFAVCFFVTKLFRSRKLKERIGE